MGQIDFFAASLAALVLLGIWSLGPAIGYLCGGCSYSVTRVGGPDECFAAERIEHLRPVLSQLVQAGFQPRGQNGLTLWISGFHWRKRWITQVYVRDDCAVNVWRRDSWAHTSLCYITVFDDGLILATTSIRDQDYELILPHHCVGGSAGCNLTELLEVHRDAIQAESVDRRALPATMEHAELALHADAEASMDELRTIAEMRIAVFCSIATTFVGVTLFFTGWSIQAVCYALLAAVAADWMLAIVLLYGVAFALYRQAERQEW